MKKTKKDDMPGDKLGIYDIKAEHLMELEDLLSFLTPDKWSGFMAYQVKPALTKAMESEEGNKEEVEKEKVKKESGKNGHTLNLRDTESGETITWPFVKTYQFCKEKEELVFVSTGDVEIVDSGNTETSVVPEETSAEVEAGAAETVDIDTVSG